MADRYQFFKLKLGDVFADLDEPFSCIFKFCSKKNECNNPIALNETEMKLLFSYLNNTMSKLLIERRPSHRLKYISQQFICTQNENVVVRIICYSKFGKYVLRLQRVEALLDKPYLLKTESLQNGGDFYFSIKDDLSELENFLKGLEGDHT